MKFHHLELVTHPLSAQKRFYIQTLGFPLLEEKSDTFSFQAGKTIFTFIEGRSSERVDYHFAFNIPVNKFEEAKAWLLRRVSLITKDDQDEFALDQQPWNARLLYFNDPAHNLVEMIARRNLNLVSDAPFTARSIVSVSEIGMPVDNVFHTVSALNAALGVELWTPIPLDRSDSFAGVGDEWGLLIIVNEGRGWFPSGVPCVAGRVTLTIRGSTDTDFVIPDTHYILRQRRSA